MPVDGQRVVGVLAADAAAAAAAATGWLSPLACGSDTGSVAAAVGGVGHVVAHT